MSAAASDSLCELLTTWAIRSRKDGKILHRVRSDEIIPDTTNRENTGLSLEHVHFIAHSIGKNGFKRRDDYSPDYQSHDIPVLIQESTQTLLGRESLSKWRVLTTEKKLFPPFPFPEYEEHPHPHPHP